MTSHPHALALAPHPRQLGHSALSVFPLGLGCMGMSEFYGPTDDEQSLATLEAAFDAGVTLYDTADTYGFGHNEALLARFIRGKGEQLQIASKCALVREPGSYARRVDNSPGYIRAACEASLKRLGVETLDLYYLHRINHETPLADSIGALAELKQAGKVRAIGVCEVSAETLREIAALAPIDAVQSEYSLWTRDPERGVLAACRDIGASFFAYSPLGRGFLTGRFANLDQLADSDFRRFNPRFAGHNLHANLKLAALVKQLAAEKGCSPAQLALAWLLAQGDDVIPIPGTRRQTYLADNLGALEVTLGTADLRQIAEAFPAGAAAGQRYSQEGMQGLNA